MNITPQQALNNLYLASRKCPLTADEHDIVRRSAEILLELIGAENKVVAKEAPLDFPKSAA